MPTQETWYLLENGSAVHPQEVIMSEDGVLKHKDGMKVAMRSAGVPSTKSVYPEQERANRPKRDISEEYKNTRDMKAEASQQQYRRR